MSAKQDETGNKGITGGGTYDKASARDKDKLIDELKNRVEFLEKELRLRQEDVNSTVVTEPEQAMDAPPMELEELVMWLREKHPVFDIINVAIAFHDAENNFVWANKTYMDYVGVPMSELKGRKCYACWGLDRLCLTCPVVRAIRTGEPQEGELSPENQPHWPPTLRSWLVRSAPVRDSEGKIIGAFEVAHDITERKRAEEALRESEDRFNAFMNNSPAIAWMKDEQGRHVYLSKTYENRFGVKLEDWRGKTDFDLWPREIAKEFRKNDREVLDTGRTAVVEEKTRGPDGGYTYWMTYKFPFQDASGNRYVGGIGVDITERKKAEEALVEAKARAELYLDLMGHDINNMNQSIQGFLELALQTLEMDGKIGMDGKVLIEKPLQAVQGSSRLISNVQKLQRLSERGVKIRPVDLHDLFEELRSLDFHVSDRDATININEVPHWLAEGSDLLWDVFFNLVSNAIKHSRPERPVTVNVGAERVEQDERTYYRCTVEDDGPGVTDELKSKLFHRFQRGKTRAHGKGLGLYLVRTLVEGYNGKVWVEDRVKGDHTKGARFVVMLPTIDE